MGGMRASRRTISLGDSNGFRTAVAPYVQSSQDAMDPLMREYYTRRHSILNKCGSDEVSIDHDYRDFDTFSKVNLATLIDRCSMAYL